jgi:hypothetical protein
MQLHPTALLRPFNSILCVLVAIPADLSILMCACSAQGPTAAPCAPVGNIAELLLKIVRLSDEPLSTKRCQAMCQVR